MPRKSSRPLQKRTLNLYEGDFEALATYFPDVDTAVIIRNAVSKIVRTAEAGANAVAIPLKDIQNVDI